MSTQRDVSSGKQLPRWQIIDRQAKTSVRIQALLLNSQTWLNYSNICKTGLTPTLWDTCMIPRTNCIKKKNPEKAFHIHVTR